MAVKSFKWSDGTDFTITYDPVEGLSTIVVNTSELKADSSIKQRTAVIELEMVDDASKVARIALTQERSSSVVLLFLIDGVADFEVETEEETKNIPLSAVATKQGTGTEGNTDYIMTASNYGGSFTITTDSALGSMVSIEAMGDQVYAVVAKNEEGLTGTTVLTCKFDDPSVGTAEASATLELIRGRYVKQKVLRMTLSETTIKADATSGTYVVLAYKQYSDNTEELDTDVAPNGDVTQLANVTEVSDVDWFSIPSKGVWDATKNESTTLDRSVELVARLEDYVDATASLTQEKLAQDEYSDPTVEFSYATMTWEGGLVTPNVIVRQHVKRADGTEEDLSSSFVEGGNLEYTVSGFSRVSGFSINPDAMTGALDWSKNNSDTEDREVEIRLIVVANNKTGTGTATAMQSKVTDVRYEAPYGLAVNLLDKVPAKGGTITLDAYKSFEPTGTFNQVKIVGESREILTLTIADISQRDCEPKDFYGEPMGYTIYDVGRPVGEVTFKYMANGQWGETTLTVQQEPNKVERIEYRNLDILEFSYSSLYSFAGEIAPTLTIQAERARIWTSGSESVDTFTASWHSEDLITNSKWVLDSSVIGGDVTPNYDFTDYILPLVFVEVVDVDGLSMREDGRVIWEANNTESARSGRIKVTVQVGAEEYHPNISNTVTATAEAEAVQQNFKVQLFGYLRYHSQIDSTAIRIGSSMFCVLPVGTSDTEPVKVNIPYSDIEIMSSQWTGDIASSSVAFVSIPFPEKPIEWASYWGSFNMLTTDYQETGTDYYARVSFSFFKSKNGDGDIKDATWVADSKLSDLAEGKIIGNAMQSDWMRTKMPIVEPNSAVETSFSIVDPDNPPTSAEDTSKLVCDIIRMNVELFDNEAGQQQDTYYRPTITLEYDEAPWEGGTVDPRFKVFQKVTYGATSETKTLELQPYQYEVLSWYLDPNSKGVTLDTNPSSPTQGRLTWSENTESARHASVTVRVRANWQISEDSTTSGGTGVDADSSVGTNNLLGAKSIVAIQKVYAGTTYGDPYGLELSAPDIPASGGDVTSSMITLSGVIYQDKSTGYPAVVTTEEFSVSDITSTRWSPTFIHGDNLKAGIFPRQRKGYMTCYYTVNGKEGSSEVAIYQEENEQFMSGYYNHSIDTFAYPVLSAIAGTAVVDLVVSFNRKITYTSGFEYAEETFTATFNRRQDSWSWVVDSDYNKNAPTTAISSVRFAYDGTHTTGATLSETIGSVQWVANNTKADREVSIEATVKFADGTTLRGTADSVQTDFSMTVPSFFEIRYGGTTATQIGAGMFGIMTEQGGSTNPLIFNVPITRTELGSNHTASGVSTPNTFSVPYPLKENSFMYFGGGRPNTYGYVDAYPTSITYAARLTWIFYSGTQANGTELARASMNQLADGVAVNNYSAYPYTTSASSQKLMFTNSSGSTNKTFAFAYTDSDGELVPNVGSIKLLVEVYDAVVIPDTYSAPLIAFSYTQAAIGGATITPKISSITQYRYPQGDTSNGELLNLLNTSGYSLSYSRQSGSTAPTINSSTGAITWPKNTGAPREVVVRAKLTANGVTNNDTTRNIATSAQVGSEYGTPTGLKLSVANLPAGGGTRYASEVVLSGTISQTLKQGSTTTTLSLSASDIESKTWSVSSLKANSLGTTTTNSLKTVGTFKLTYVVNGVEGTASVTLYQDINELTLGSYYNNKVVSFSYPDKSALAGNVYPDSLVLSFNRQGTYTSGANAPLETWRATWLGYNTTTQVNEWEWDITSWYNTQEPTSAIGTMKFTTVGSANGSEIFNTSGRLYWSANSTGADRSRGVLLTVSLNGTSVTSTTYPKQLAYAMTLPIYYQVTSTSAYATSSAGQVGSSLFMLLPEQGSAAEPLSVATPITKAYNIGKAVALSQPSAFVVNYPTKANSYMCYGKGMVEVSPLGHDYAVDVTWIFLKGSTNGTGGTEVARAKASLLPANSTIAYDSTKQLKFTNSNGSTNKTFAFSDSNGNALVDTIKVLVNVVDVVVAPNTYAAPKATGSYASATTPVSVSGGTDAFTLKTLTQVVTYGDGSGTSTLNLLQSANASMWSKTFSKQSGSGTVNASDGTVTWSANTGDARSTVVRLTINANGVPATFDFESKQAGVVDTSKTITLKTYAIASTSDSSSLYYYNTTIGANGSVSISAVGSSTANPVVINASLTERTAVSDGTVDNASSGVVSSSALSVKLDKPEALVSSVVLNGSVIVKDSSGNYVDSYTMQMQVVFRKGTTIVSESAWTAYGVTAYNTTVAMGTSFRFFNTGSSTANVDNVLLRFRVK